MNSISNRNSAPSAPSRSSSNEGVTHHKHSMGGNPSNVEHGYNPGPVDTVSISHPHLPSDVRPMPTPHFDPSDSVNGFDPHTESPGYNPWETVTHHNNEDTYSHHNINTHGVHPTPDPHVAFGTLNIVA